MAAASRSSPGRLEQYLGCDPNAVPPECPDGLDAEASPRYNITPDDPPIFLMDGTKDTITPIDSQVQPTHTALLAAGITARLYAIQSACHGIKCKPIDPALERNSAEWAHALLDDTQPTVHLETGPVSLSPITVGTFTFTVDPGVSAKCGFDGAALTPCTSPVSVSGLTPGQHTLTVQGTNGSGSGTPTDTAWMLTPLAVTAKDFTYTPSGPKTSPGSLVRWTNNGPSQHTVTDKSGMGYFDSGPMAAGATFDVIFLGAGTYNYFSTLDAAMQNSIKIPISAAPSSGPAGSTFEIMWAAAPPPAGYVYDVQIKIPGGSGFTNWMTGQTATETVTTLNTPGTYQFRAHLKNTVAAKSSGWSPTLSVTVTG
jgi:plastocyanin